MLGVDEAGRGPLAGPVAVGVVAVPEGFDVAREFPGVADSKSLSEKKREEIFRMLEERAGRGDVRFVVELESATAIDANGIARALRAAVARGVSKLANDTGLAKSDMRVMLDGALVAPEEYAQETIIRGDALIPLISLASIAAKVSRDRLMVALAEKHLEYGFERHKGYGTRAHYDVLARYGPCAIHRMSFLHL